ncbi:SDR family oxidoreductase [Pendulispora brunnea]|uniref:SDR family oxidoreductase n=1 Tax=Pendulispora brunnea TaxID=2905690 RepID=A0ABZ2K2C3_9BACT
MPNDMLEGAVSLVTGGAQGIGWAIAQAFADHGARVHVCDISEAAIARAQASLVEAPWGSRITIHRCDVSQRNEVERLIETIVARDGRIDVLVNNAAFIRCKPIDELTIDEAEASMRVAYNGMVYTVKSVLPAMRARGSGYVVNLGSSAGRIQLGQTSTAYAATKAAIEAYTRELQVELEGSGVSAILIRPGAVAGTTFFGEHVPWSRMPRASDFIPVLLPPNVAEAVVHAIQRRQLVMDVPSYLPWVYLFFDLAPRLFRRLLAVGGGSQRDHGAAAWRYEGNDREVRR